MPAKSKLPAQLPLLPLYDSVLLPGAFTRVKFKRDGTISGPLLQNLLAQQEEQIFVAAVPVAQDLAEGQEGAEEADTVSVKIGDVATAARVMQMLRVTQDDSWVIMLEGWCRIKLQAPPKDALQAFTFLNVKQMGPSKNARFKEVELDKEGHALAGALHLGTSKLSQLLGQSVGSTATGRLADLLQKLSPPAAADMLVSMLTQSVAYKLQVLAAVDHNERMRLALTLVQQWMDFNITGPLRDHLKYITGGFDRAQLVQTLERLKGTNKEPAEETGDTQTKQLALRRQAYHLLQRAALTPGNKGGGSEAEEEDEEELSALMARLKAAKPPAEVLKVAHREHRRLKKSNEQHPGYAMSRAYLETLADLPWNAFSGQRREQMQDGAKPVTDEDQGDASDPPPGEQHTEANHADSSQAGDESSHSRPPLPAQPSLAEARELLDAEHYGLDKVKDRIVQYLAVRRLRGPEARAPILCFVGPPGTGKTSLANSIAKVLQRPFQRVSVGGVRDEAEIRGHRRTYIGAMPGRIIQSLRRSGVRDPVLLLDEVDKMGHDSLRGDPSAALLEVLDPNQNHAFVDTYLSVAFDLSQVVFVATANQLQDMSRPLLDRLEIIQLSGYTLEEKEHIAQRHLIPGLLQEHGLGEGQLVFPSDALQLIADGYTREAGVRGLSRSLAAICRHVAVQIVSQEDARLQDDLPHRSRSTANLQDSAHPDQLMPYSVSASNVTQHQHSRQHTGPSADFLNSPSTSAGSAHQVSFSMTGQHTEFGTGESQATASGGGLSWGTLWGGLKGALGPTRAHTVDRQTHASTSKQQHSHQSQHESPASSEQLQQQLPLSNPYGGMNADLDAPEQPALPCITVTAELIEEVLGPRKYNELDSADSLMSPGSVAGLVWTAAGGQVQYVECCCTSRGQTGRQGKLVLTGQAGEVLQESAHLALSWIRSHSHQLQQAANSSHQQPQPSGHMPQQAMADASSPASAQQQPLSALNYDQSGQTALHKRVDRIQDTSNDMVALQQSAASSQASCRLPQQASCDQPAVSSTWLGTGLHAGRCTAQCSACDVRPSSCSAPVVGGSNRQAGVGCTSSSGWSEVGDDSDHMPTSGRARQEGGSGQSEQHAVATAAAQWDVHVHLPAGAVSKDGPSAGITLATGLVSLFLDRCVRDDTAMTGELTLRGLVLPIGGLKEKLLAAHHAVYCCCMLWKSLSTKHWHVPGIKRVLVPKRNWRDVKADVPAAIKDSLEIIPVHVLEDVLQQAFDPPLVLQPLSRI